MTREEDKKIKKRKEKVKKDDSFVESVEDFGFVEEEDFGDNIDEELEREDQKEKEEHIIKGEKHKKHKKHKDKKKMHHKREHLKEKEELEDEGDFEVTPLVMPKKEKHLKKHLKEKKHKGNIDETLHEIYEDEDGNIPDMSKFQKKKKRSLLKAFIVLFLSMFFLAAVAWLGFFVIGSQNKFSEENVRLSITGDEDVTIGQEVNYRVRYRNMQNTALNNAVLEIRYPEGFVFLSSSVSSTNETNDQWNLKTISRQGGDFIDIKGILYGDIGKKQSFRAFLNYQPENFNSNFQQVASINTVISKTPIELSFDAPQNVVSGVETDLKIKVKNTSDNALNNLAVFVEPYSGFSKVESTPESDDFEDLKWTISTLESQEEKEVSLKGIFNIVNDSAILIASLRGWKGETQDGEGYVYASSTYSPEISLKTVSVRLAINGSLNDFTALPGDTLNTTITVSNDGNSIIKDVRVRMIFDAPSFNKKSILKWEDLMDENNGTILGEQRSEDIRRGYVNWDKGDIKELASINPGEKIFIDFSLPIKDSGDLTLSDFKNFVVNANTEIQYDSEGEKEFLSGNPIKITLNSDADLKVEDSISQDSDGRDVHAVSWILTNTFHPLKDIKLEADFYGDLSWDESTLSVPAGEVSFDNITKKVIWIVPEMPISVDVLALQFNLTINKTNPSQTAFSSEVKGVLTDSVTNEQIFLLGEEISLNQ